MIVVGGGISGIACAAALTDAGRPVTVRDRGHRLGGRMASRALRNSDTGFDGRPVDIGASYFTASHPEFVATVERLVEQGVVRPWTDTFHVATRDGIEGVKTGPMRYAAPRGLRSVVEALAPSDADIRLGDEVRRVAIDDHGAVVVDDVAVDAAAICLPRPQADRICDVLPETSIGWEPVIAVTLVFDSRTWREIDGVFVNDDPVLTWIADDGRRRGDDAPVLVAHVGSVLSAMHLHNPAAVVAPAVAALRRVLGIEDYPRWVETQRWTFARPLGAEEQACWVHPEAPLGLAGDAWAGGPRVEAAWLSGHQLGRSLADG